MRTGVEILDTVVQKGLIKQATHRDQGESQGGEETDHGAPDGPLSDWLQLREMGIFGEILARTVM